jgi:hypothetical protein
VGDFFNVNSGGGEDEELRDPNPVLDPVVNMRPVIHQDSYLPSIVWINDAR